MKEYIKLPFLFVFGASLYYAIELLWRGYSHWSMFILGGICFIYAGLQNKTHRQEVPLWKQALKVDLFVLVMEFITGCIVNLWLGWNIWDYSDLHFNLLGQSSLLFGVLFFPLCLLAIILDEYLRFFLYAEEKPHLHFF